MTSAIPVQCYYLTNLSNQLHPCVHVCLKLWPSCVQWPTLRLLVLTMSLLFRVA